MKNDPTIKFIRAVSYDDLEYNDYRYRKKGFRKYLIDKIKVEIEYEKKEKYNFLEDKIEWVSDPDLLWLDINSVQITNSFGDFTQKVR